MIFKIILTKLAISTNNIPNDLFIATPGLSKKNIWTSHTALQYALLAWRFERRPYNTPSVGDVAVMWT